jgi:hypothetical protein
MARNKEKHYLHSFSTLLWNMPLEGSKRTRRAETERAHQLLAYAGDVNIVGENSDTIKKNTEAQLDASKKFGLEVNPEETKYMLMSSNQKIGQKRSIKIVNRSFKDVVKFCLELSIFFHGASAVRVLAVGCRLTTALADLSLTASKQPTHQKAN